MSRESSLGYQDLPEKEKERLQQYGREQYKELPEDKKQRLVD